MSLEELEEFVRHLIGPTAVLRKLKKLSDSEFDVIVEAARQERLIKLAYDRKRRRWRARTGS